MFRVKTWNIQELTGYEPQTTFYEDFSIADAFGISAIKDTYKRGLETCKALGYIYLTEFVLALNWKIWEHYKSNDTIARVYNDLWMQACEIATTTLQGEELSYYYRTTD
jgi:hypothetical protein